MASGLRILVLGTLALGAEAFAPPPAAPFLRPSARSSLRPGGLSSSSPHPLISSSSRASRLLMSSQPAAESSEAKVPTTDKLVGVIGATGGVGRLTAAALVQQGYKVRAIVRDSNKAKTFFPEDVEVVEAQVTNPESGVGLAVAIQGLDSLVVCSGTTAFPSDKWGKDKSNNPQAVDLQGVKNVVEAVEAVNSQGGKMVKQVSLLSSVGVQRRTQFPFIILNAFGVLDAKAAGEEILKEGAKQAGYSYSIVRPGRLVGEPFTNPDFATLLKLEEGKNQNVQLANGDTLAGDCSRRQTALALVQSIYQDRGNMDFSVVSKPGPPVTQQAWDDNFDTLTRPSEAMRLQFADIEKDKFKKWIVGWGNGILTSGALFPPLPVPFRVDYPENKDEIGLQLSFLKVSVVGEIEEMGQVVVRLIDDKKGPALVAIREPASKDTPYPGETQILEKLAEDLARVSSNTQDSSAPQNVWGSNNIDF